MYDLPLLIFFIMDSIFKNIITMVFIMMLSVRVSDIAYYSNDDYRCIFITLANLNQLIDRGYI